jgi:hypothetical protein
MTRVQSVKRCLRSVFELSFPMATHFLTLELDLAAPAQLQQAILAELNRYGAPLRWAIVAVDADRGKVQIEAVVTAEITLRIPVGAVTTV